jgi:nucleoid-associated protein YgaU
MGIFSFFKKAGKGALKTTTKEPTISAEVERKNRIASLEREVHALNTSVKNLDILLNDDKITVYGQTESQADREKIILALGNIEGIATVDDRISVVKPAPEAKFYEVKKGDTLSKIAKEFYGNAMKYPTIFEANQPMLKSPDLIYPGQVLRIPPLEEK